MADIEKEAIETKVANRNDRAPSPVDLTARQGSLASTKEGRKVLEHSHDADEAMKAFANGEVVEVTPEDNKRLLRKIDAHMLPVMCVVYGLNYLDKTTVNTFCGFRK
jgi:hypothetical protein